MKLTLDEVRRLTGPNLLSDKPGAILDVFIQDISPHFVVETWIAKLKICLDAVKWQENYYTRFYDGGVSVSISAPMDLLYSACDLLELSWDACVAEIAKEPINLPMRLNVLKQTIKDEANPALIAFMQQAQQHNVVCLADDDEISLGTGPTTQVWPITQLPALSSINWQAFKSVPLALITGTNGKSTSVRLAAQIAKAANIQAGVTSTDFIKVGNTIIDEGDYSGPGGARMLLRDTRTQMAFLEVARGGLLRRGLPVDQANAALVTNAASDHLGQYGINTVDEIAHVKLMVAKAIKHANQLVLNADDKLLVKYSSKLDVPICWFSTNADNPLIKQQIAQQQPCVFVQNNHIIYSHKSQSNICEVNLIPMTVKGTATHNVQNALGVVGLCIALGIEQSAIKQGLMSFGSNAQDNPGRTNIYDVKGMKVVVDFAHNAHSMQAVMDMANKMPSKNIHVMFSHAGDRSNKDITDVADAIHKLAPQRYILAELPEYLRGREVNEVSQLVEQHLLQKGVLKANISCASDPVAGAQQAFEQAQTGDLLLLFVLSNREQVQDFLHSQ